MLILKLIRYKLYNIGRKSLRIAKFWQYALKYFMPKSVSKHDEVFILLMDIYIYYEQYYDYYYVIIVL